MKSCLPVLLISLLFLGCADRQTEEQLQARAQAFEKEEKFENALETYQKLLKSYPDGKHADEAQYKIAFLYYNNLHNFNRALEAHQRLVEKYPESNYVSQARFMIGYIYANDLKDYDQARAAYEEFLKLYPDNELVESVKWELKHLGEDINEQLLQQFSDKKTNGGTKVAK
ncbi:MAG: tol-pal system YbgF family protein [bacterium]